MIDQSDIALIPQWTVPSFRSIAGRFPLGLEAVSLNIMANRLAPGLPVLSRHPRYWSIYTFLIKRFQDRGTHTNKTNNAALGRYLKAHEIVFGCAALMCPHHNQEPLRSVIGADTFNPWLSKNRHLSPRAQLPTSLTGELGEYLQQSLGGYGQVYRGAMIDLELILPFEMNPKAKFDVVYGEVGTAVADTFAEAIAHTRYVREYLDKDDVTIPLDVIEELGAASCFCQLRTHEPERKLLVEVLLGQAQQRAKTHAQDAVTVEKRLQRTETIRLFLDLAEQTQSFTLNEMCFRDLLYVGNSGKIEWYLRQHVQQIWRQWWLIQLREVIVKALNSLFLDSVKWGVKEQADSGSANLDNYIHTVGSLPLPPLPGLPDTDLAHVSLAQLSYLLDQHSVHPVWSLSQETQQENNTLISERLLTSYEPTPITFFFTLLLAQRRLAFIKQHVSFTRNECTLLQEGGKDRLSTGYILHWFEERIERDVLAVQAFTELVNEMIIAQHSKVAMGKLPIDTFRFYDDEEGIRFTPHQDIDMSPISVRFDAISEALYRLGLIQASLSKSSHAPTQFGWEVING